MDSQYLQFGCISPHSVSDGKVNHSYVNNSHTYTHILFQSLHVTNHTEETICCIWMNGTSTIIEHTYMYMYIENRHTIAAFHIPTYYITVCRMLYTESGGTFSVTPQEREIPPGTTCLFTAHFKPVHSFNPSRCTYTL